MTRKIQFKKSRVRNKMPVQAKKIILSKPFKGEPALGNFEIVEEKLEALKDGEVLVEAEWLSVDPYIRDYMEYFPARSQMIGFQVAKVIESKDPSFLPGNFVVGHFGWRTHTIFNPSENSDDLIKPYNLPKLGNLPRSLAIGPLGMVGNTAFFGLMKICEPEQGETLVTMVPSGAAGAVGSLAGQIGKIKGLTVIGITGSDEKCEWLTKTLGFDHAINYETADIGEELKKVAPNGVDCYFDNVGGTISSIVLHQMNKFGRIAVSGSIAAYNEKCDPEKVPYLTKLFDRKHLRMESFSVWSWHDRWIEGIKQMAEWVEQNKIKYEETITQSFNNTPKAFIQMLRDENIRKVVVKA